MIYALLFELQVLSSLFVCMLHFWHSTKKRHSIQDIIMELDTKDAEKKNTWVSM